MRFVISIAGVLIFAAACAAPAQVTQIGTDRYSVSVGAMGIEGGEAAARNKALAVASDYCAQRGQQLNLVKMQSKGPVEWGSAAGSASAEFQCNPK